MVTTGSTVIFSTGSTVIDYRQSSSSRTDWALLSSSLRWLVLLSKHFRDDMGIALMCVNVDTFD